LECGYLLLAYDCEKERKITTVVRIRAMVDKRKEMLARPLTQGLSGCKLILEKPESLKKNHLDTALGF
jgi:hypothetical protein